MDDIEYHYVLGIDPGGTTGIAMFRYSDDTPAELIYVHQIENGIAGFKEWFNGSRKNEWLDIVSEHFTLREGVHGVDLTPKMIEGAQYMIWDDQVVYQEPEVKSLIPDDFLREQGLWIEGQRHAMDAIIHALVFLRNEKDHKPTQASLAGDNPIPMELGDASEKVLGDDHGGVFAPDEIEFAKEFLKVVTARREQESGEGEAEGEGDGTETGDSNDEIEGVLGHGKDDRVMDGKPRQINGVFAGYAPKDANSGSVLFEGEL